MPVGAVHVGDTVDRRPEGPRLPATGYELFRGVSALDDHELDDAAGGAAEARGFLIFRRLEARDALLQGGELDHDEAVERLRAFHDLILATASEHRAAVLLHDGRDPIGVPLV